MLTNDIVRKVENTSGGKNASAILFAERVLSAASNDKVPLLEKIGFVRIALDNIEEYLSNRSTKASIEFKGRSNSIVVGLLTRAHKIMSSCKYTLDNVKIPDIDKKVTLKYDDQSDKDNSKWVINPNHYYCILFNKANPSDFGLVEIGDTLMDVDCGDEYYSILIKFILNNNYDYISNELNIYNIEELTSTTNFKENAVISYAYIWTEHSLDNQILKILMNSLSDKGIIPFKLDKELMLLPYKDLSMTRRLYPEFCFEKFVSEDLNIDFKTVMKNEKEKSFLIRTPFQSFSNVEKFIEDMCTADYIHTIYITLYRLTDSGRIIRALLKAIQAKKKVIIFIEANARGNENGNLHILELINTYANKYNNVAIFCNHGGAKVHAKMFLAMGDDKGYVHCGTGNYNEKTGNRYIDTHLITTNSNIVKYILTLFETITDFQDYNIRNNSGVVTTIEKEFLKEIEKGPKGYIRIKTNHINDGKMIELIKIAHHKGVKIDLIIRTTIPKELANLVGLNVRIYSIIGRFLHHERFYIFGKGKSAKVYISSADLLYRNLYKRIECLIPITNTDFKNRIISVFENEIL